MSVLLSLTPYFGLGFLDSPNSKVLISLSENYGGANY
jgi:hypothetical protein